MYDNIGGQACGRVRALRGFRFIILCVCADFLDFVVLRMYLCMYFILTVQESSYVDWTLRTLALPLLGPLPWSSSTFLISR